MRLNKIKLAGFKSFVDPTSIQLPSNLIGIVGPNGCGKSNVIDAVRWVMGESSAKNLRGDSMADVIFNGSNSRKPVGQATIELIFDNSDGSVGGQYASFAEISIKRQVARDGQSSYFLNGVRCRRRDITDLFLGTGLGPRSYAIIEQGMISRLIEAKPEELRIFLEEAAGISRYKERRRETESRMRQTRENLDRLNDLRGEVEKQLQHLQRQAKAAEKYQQLREEERTVRSELLALRWRRVNEESGAGERRIREREVALEAAIAQLRAVEAAAERDRERQIEANERFNEVQGRYYALGAEIARLEQALQHGRDLRRQQQQDLTQLERAWTELQEHIDLDRARLEELAAGLEEAEPALELAREEGRGSAQALTQAEQAMHDWQARWEEFNRGASELAQSAQVQRTRIDHLERHLLQLEQRRARFEEEQRNLGGDSLAAELESLERELAEREAEGGLLQAEHEEVLEAIRTLRERNSHTAAELDAARGRVQSARGRLASLEALQQAALGKRAGAVTAWLKEQRLDEAPRLAEQLEVEAGWEHAVETVLGLHLEAVCVEGFEAVSAALDRLHKGALALFDTGAAARPAVDGAAAPLLAKVQAPWPLDGMLGGVYAAASLAEALALRAGLAAHESVITPEGVWLGPAWLRLARDPDEHAGVLAREHELKTLTTELRELAAQVEAFEERLGAGRVELGTLEERREAVQAAVNQAGRRQSELRAQVGGKQARLEQLRLRRGQIDAELRELQSQAHKDEAEAAGARTALSEALGRLEVVAEERDRLTGGREELRAALEQARERARVSRDAAHEIALRIESLRTARVSTGQNLERMQGQLAHLQSRREELDAALAGGDAPLEALARELEALLARRMEVEASLAEARALVEEIDAGLRQLSQGRHAAESKAQECRAALEEMRIGWQELKVRRQTLEEQIDATGLERQALLEALPEEAAEGEWETRLAALGERIQRLGAVNLAAIDEFAEQSQRKTYLDAQHADLSEALETLENAIRKIDRETRTRFKETFDKVNSGLQAMFPRLFGGGHGYLELTGEDLLDTGVLVMARPPGKRISSIHLLSGGEKALTAVALVFAIFELNPAPFCMLDEVDAPLDEANVGRFCEMVQAMSERVQFIFITHNKTTMEMARHLTGVTMHEPGVSRLVAVDVDEAVQLAAV
jgi:chromosome segregation protein